MKAEIILDWDYGTPKHDGLYFAAVKHGEGAGMQEFLHYKDGKWDLEYGGKIVAFIDIGNLNKQLNVRWPKENPVLASDVSDDEFKEV